MYPTIQSFDSTGGAIFQPPQQPQPGAAGYQPRPPPANGLATASSLPPPGSQAFPTLRVHIAEPYRTAPPVRSQARSSMSLGCVAALMLPDHLCCVRRCEQRYQGCLLQNLRILYRWTMSASCWKTWQPLAAATAVQQRYCAGEVWGEGQQGDNCSFLNVPLQAWVSADINWA